MKLSLQCISWAYNHLLGLYCNQKFIGLARAVTMKLSLQCISWAYNHLLSLPFNQTLWSAVPAKYCHHVMFLPAVRQLGLITS